MNRRARIALTVLAVVALAAAGWWLCRGSASPETPRAVAKAALPAPKVAPLRLQPGLPTEGERLVSLTIVPAPDAELNDLKARLVALGGEITGVAGESTRLRLRVKLPGAVISRLADFEGVDWVERYEPPHILNNVAVQPGLMNVTPVWETHGLTGKGQFITVSDTGIDTGNTRTLHLDLRDNVAGMKRGNDFYAVLYDPTGHGTHVAGSIVGNGAMSGGEVRGVAYEAKLWMWCCTSKSGRDLYLPQSYSQCFRPSSLVAGVPYIHSASWGGTTNVYNSESQEIDEYVWRHPEFLPVFAAGNDGLKRSITCQAAAKNALAVGATESYRPEKKSYSAKYINRIASYSSRGPMPDGRIKPDLVAPGSWILSTASTSGDSAYFGYEEGYDGYAYCIGTSMACPLVAGCAALVRQWLVERRGFTNAVPSAALVKAVLTGGATELRGLKDATLSVNAPNGDEGWGRVDVAASLYPTNGLSVRLYDYIPFVDGGEWRQRFRLKASAPLSAQLVWVDYPATPRDALAKSLVNDLDLVVSNETTGAVWTMDDHINNVEAVRIELAEPGDYSVIVRGTDVPYPSTLSPYYGGGGAAALYLRGAFAETGRGLIIFLR